MSIVDFLNARIAEDEDEARRALHPPWRSDGLYVVLNEPADEARDPEPRYGAVWHPRRVLAECESKRRVVTLVGTVAEGRLDGASVSLWADRTLRALAAVYADHPHFQAQWLS